jgi:hypothetical protein
MFGIIFICCKSLKEKFGKLKAVLLFFQYFFKLIKKLEKLFMGIIMANIILCSVDNSWLLLASNKNKYNYQWFTGQ